jgi:hypothetical protein
MIDIPPIGIDVIPNTADFSGWVIPIIITENLYVFALLLINHNLILFTGFCTFAIQV